MFRLRYKEKVAAGSPGGREGREVGGPRRQSKAEDQRPFRMEQQMADEEAAWHALTFIQVHRERRRQRTRATSFISSAECMHKQCNLFKSHYILLFMSRKTEAEIQDYRAPQV